MKRLEFALILVLGSCSGSCSKGAGSAEENAQRGTLVARVGKAELREEDIKRAMERDPGASAERFQSPVARGELIDGLVRFELLAQAADRAGFTKDPDAIHALRQIAVTKFVNQTLGSTASPDSVTQADVEREYAARRTTEFTLPEAVHVRHILVSDAKAAEHVAAQARKLAPTDDQGFARLVSTSSEDSATRGTGGDLGFIEKSSRLPRALVDAAFGLKTPGEVAGPIKTESGYEIVRLVVRRAPAVSPLSSVQEPIRQRLYRERRAKALEELMARLRQETPIEVIESKPSRAGVP